MKILKSEDDSQRFLAAAGAKGFKNASPELIAALIQALSDHSEMVRGAAAESLGTVEPKLPEAIPALISATNDEEEWVREAATESLGKYQGAADMRLAVIMEGALQAGRLEWYSAPSNALADGAAEFYPLLVQLARDDKADESRRALAIHGIFMLRHDEQFITDQRLREMGELIHRLAVDDAQPITVRAAAGCSLRYINDALEQYEDASVLIAAVEQATLPGTREQCVFLLGHKRVQAAIPVLLKAVKDPDEHVAWQALSALADFGSDAAPAVPVLIELLNDRETPDRDYICYTLGVIGASHETSLPALTRAMDDEDRSVRGSAMLAIAQLVVKHDLEAEPWIAKILVRLPQEEEPIRNLAFEALAVLGPKAAPATPQLVSFLQDESLREKAAETLGAIDPAAQEAVPEMIKLLDSPDSSTRYATINALAQMGTSAQDAVPMLKALASADPEQHVRRTASEALAELVPNDPAMEAE